MKGRGGSASSDGVCVHSSGRQSESCLNSSAPQGRVWTWTQAAGSRLCAGNHRTTWLQSPRPCEQRGCGGSLLLLELPLSGEAVSGKDGVFRWVQQCGKISQGVCAAHITVGSTVRGVQGLPPGSVSGTYQPPTAPGSQPPPQSAVLELTSRTELCAVSVPHTAPILWGPVEDGVLRTLSSSKTPQTSQH